MKKKIILTSDGNWYYLYGITDIMEKIEGRGTILYFTFNLGKEFFRDTFFFYSLSMWKYHGKDEEIIGEWEVDETNFNIEDLEKKIKTAVKLRELSELMAEEL